MSTLSTLIRVLESYDVGRAPKSTIFVAASAIDNEFAGMAGIKIGATAAEGKILGRRVVVINDIMLSNSRKNNSGFIEEVLKMGDQTS